MRKTGRKARGILGAGEYESTRLDEEKPSRKDAQGNFLKAVKSLAPKVLDDLSGEPFNLYKQTTLYYEADEKRRSRDDVASRYMWTEYQRPSWQNIESPPDENDWRWECFSVSTDRRTLAFRDGLFRWSRDNNLDETWCRQRAYDTLDYWCASTHGYEQRSWDFQLNLPPSFMIGSELRFVFERKSNYPLHNSHKDELDLAVEMFRRDYDSFLSKVDENAEAGGLTPAPPKPPDHHYEMLVRYHLEGWRYSKLAKEYLLSESRVAHLIPQVSKLIGLTLRNRQGRPSKT